MVLQGMDHQVSRCRRLEEKESKGGDPVIWIASV